MLEKRRTKNSETNKTAKKLGTAQYLKRDLKLNFDLYLLVIPVIAYYIIFHYAPMYGAIIAFKKFSPAAGILGSKWVGFKNFLDFFQSANFGKLLYNTVNISVKTLIVGFPAPIIFALLLNEIRSSKASGLVKTVSYFPHFVSIVIICGMIKVFVADTGFVGGLVNKFTGGTTSLLNDPKYFVPIYVTSDLWQQMGWNSIIYMAAIAGIDQQLYEAATIDGAGKWKQLLHVTLPGIAPTIVLLFIMRMGGIVSVGYEKIILLYNEMTYETADVISSYVYRKGLQEFNYSFSTAVGLFNSAINFTFVIITNYITKKVSSIGLM